MQAAPPIPRKAADNAATASQNIKDNSSQKQESTGQPLPVLNPNKSPTANRNTYQQSSDDAEHTVGISKLPPVSITREWPDWGLWVFNFLLVIVGILQVVLLLGTLRAIKHQADLMEQQAKAMGEQAKVMEGQLREMEKSREIETKTLILQYRPRITVRDAKASDFNVSEFGKPMQGKVEFKVVNTGGSVAHVTGGFVSLWSCEAPELPTSPIEIKSGEEALISEFTLQPGEDTILKQSLPTGATYNVEWANYHAGIRVQPLKQIDLVGMVCYVDDLGIPRRTGISRTYEPKTKTFTPKRDSEGEYTD
jgi:hypothetical protein